ncbi:MAG: PfkB family carbohydrate kinase [Candidatus Omnitrophica bacterium]|nr:PfkB family carbohydrate kinase [Candidatus Omnitrophota bacterium]
MKLFKIRIITFLMIQAILTVNMPLTLGKDIACSSDYDRQFKNSLLSPQIWLNSIFFRNYFLKETDLNRQSMLLTKSLQEWINYELKLSSDTPLDWETIDRFNRQFAAEKDRQNESVNALWKILGDRLAFVLPRVLTEELHPRHLSDTATKTAPSIIALAVPNTMVLYAQLTEDKSGFAIADVEMMSAGKVIGAAQSLTALGRNIQLVSLVGKGKVGERFKKYIEAFPFEKKIFVETQQDTRLWPAIVRQLDAHEWRFSAPGPSISREEENSVDKAVSDLYAAAAPGTIVIMGGKTPLGLKASFWTEHIKKAREHNLRVFFDNLDTNCSRRELWDILAAGVEVIKPNIIEFANLTGKNPENLFDYPALIVDEARRLIHAIREQGGVLKTIVISRGNKETILVTPNEAFMAAAPKIIPENHIGAGDTMIGALAHKLSLHASLAEALQFTVASATISTQKAGIMRSATIEEAEAMAVDIPVMPVQGTQDAEVWEMDDLTPDLFEFDQKAVKKAVRFFESDQDPVQLEKDLMKIKGVNRVHWSGDVLTITGSTEVVTFSERENEINERMGLKDRLYIKSDRVGRELTVGIYKRDRRDDKMHVGSVYVLGVGRNSHDSGAVLLKDGAVVGAIEEERLNMNKHTRAYFPVNAVRYLLKNHGISWDQIDHIAVTYDYNWFRDTPHSISPRDHFHQELGLPGLSADKEKYDTDRLEIFLQSLARDYGSEYVPPVTFVKHHKAHAAASWYTSGFPEPALVITIDGRGEDEASTVWLCSEGRMRKITSNLYIHSLGHFYHIFTKYLGYKSHDEGKFMGFAPYGAPRNDVEKARVEKLRTLVDKTASFDEQSGQVFLDQSCFNFFTLKSFPEMNFSNLFLRELGELVPPFPKGLTGRNLDPDKEEFRPYANLAYVVQEKLERCVIQTLSYYRNKHSLTKGVEYVVMSGGLLLNIAANGKIVESGVVDADKFLVPAFSADDGTPAGAALSVTDEEYGLNVRNAVKKISLGKTYSDEEIESALRGFGLREGRDYFPVKDDIALLATVAGTLENDKTVAWFQGGAELGPRALGNRSILHRLDDPEGNLKVNSIKNRESWRPSALSIQQEKATEFLKGIAVSPFMTIGFKVTDEKKDLIKAGVHPADGTTRPQTVSRQANPLYWELLEEMRRRTGVPGVLNTSFNRWGPIVETPEDALNTFYYGDGIDMLAIGHFIVKRTENLKPSILNPRDEPSLRESFNKARYNGSEDEPWEEFFKNVETLAASRRPWHQHFLIASVVNSGGKKELLRLPLCKDMFQTGPCEEMVPFLARLIDQKIGDAQEATVMIETTAAQYADVVFGLFRDFAPEQIIKKWHIIKSLNDYTLPVYLPSVAKEKAWGAGPERIGEHSWEPDNNNSLVKLLTLGDSVAPQFHSDKDEVLLITGVDSEFAGGQPKVMAGFSSVAGKKYGAQIKAEYKAAVERYAGHLMALITALKDNGYEATMDEYGKVVVAAEKALKHGKNELIAAALGRVKNSREAVEFFYDYMEVSAGDVVVIPKNCLHAAGAGNVIYEAQFSGDIISLDDMDKYPVRYSPVNAPEWIRTGAKGILGWEKIPKIDEHVRAYKLTPKSVETGAGVAEETLGFSGADEARGIKKIIMQKGRESEVCDNVAAHIIHSVAGEATVVIDGHAYAIPHIAANGAALFIPASVEAYTIRATSDAQVLDTFRTQPRGKVVRNIYSDTEYPNPLMPLLNKAVFTFVRDILYDRYEHYKLDTSLVDRMLEYAISNRYAPESACAEIYKHVLNFNAKNEKTSFHDVYFGSYKKDVKPALLRDLIKGKVQSGVVLDAGAGMSALALGLLKENPGIERFISTHNIDYKRVAIADPRMEFIAEQTGRGFSLPLQDGVADTIIITGRLHHLYPGKEKEFFREMFRVLSLKGKILIIEDAWSEGMKDPAVDEFAKKFRKLTVQQKHDVSAVLDWIGTRLIPGPELMPRPWNFKSVEDWEEQLFKPCGFNVESKQYYGFPDKKFTPLPQCVIELRKNEAVGDIMSLKKTSVKTVFENDGIEMSI